MNLWQENAPQICDFKGLRLRMSCLFFCSELVTTSAKVNYKSITFNPHWLQSDPKPAGCQFTESQRQANSECLPVISQCKLNWSVPNTECHKNKLKKKRECFVKVTSAVGCFHGSGCFNSQAECDWCLWVCVYKHVTSSSERQKIHLRDHISLV